MNDVHHVRMTREQLAVLLALTMVNDYPLEPAARELHAFMDGAACTFGYKSWIDAYHDPWMRTTLTAPEAKPEPSRELPEIELCYPEWRDGPLLATTPETGTRFHTAEQLVAAARRRGIHKLRVRPEQAGAILPRFCNIAGVLGSLPDAEISIVPQGAMEAGERKRRDESGPMPEQARRFAPGMTLHSWHIGDTGGVAEFTERWDNARCPSGGWRLLDQRRGGRATVLGMAQRARLDALAEAERLVDMRVKLNAGHPRGSLLDALERLIEDAVQRLATATAGDSPDSAPGGHGPENPGSGDSVSPCDPAGGPTR